ncbi:hypothetical protein LWI29_019207 [Acer saccharum]|uniref:Uncharacterized protein n=1 Tax=Acer saccharum TaxID=4024 RepID=A0AA39VKQ5_ACESA|nr:hypothetical protein LWI29_019207 [Acer saccharum]
MGSFGIIVFTRSKRVLSGVSVMLVRMNADDVALLCGALLLKRRRPLMPLRNQVSIASQQPQVVLAPNNFPLSYRSFTFNGNVLKESSRFPILENNKCFDYIHAGEVGCGFTCFQYRSRPGEAFLFNPLRRQVLVLPMATCIGQAHWYGMGIDSNKFIKLFTLYHRWIQVAWQLKFTLWAQNHRGDKSLRFRLSLFVGRVSIISLSICSWRHALDGST